ncbi:2-polyprenyl-6-methoxyphenol hydroxylase-like FAD-dependent oxidoreductase [Paenibacillus shirakamiensis]|uniref:2-polyprenyl-6-methoxyphenol hydroxylase-like FAD-dependent oxidoreductase n=1 Tax=Paenibacillus shirakamiensis TaxID=1265935 RepID=A0ABS4JHK5_9BACL|nr:FAD-dependent monooxygenase [Paenibacillus shirakamiensis]MBP2000039.1 2-polyprenyl-6-methoxyphenol hydroxylase-like FAD-dependent oxidoreductase [Paenibacillus shirakamiensis]
MKKNILISGASFAGLSTAFWMKKLGYQVTIVEIAKGLKKGGTPVNIRGNTVDIMSRMGLLKQIQSNQIKMEVMEYKNSDDVTVRVDSMQRGSEQLAEEYEIERDVLLTILFEAVEDDVEFLFGENIVSIQQKNDGVDVAFKGGQSRSYDLVFGCDGIHSAVRKYCFGEETQFSHFLKNYFSITIINKLLIPENTSQLYNEPGKAVMLNAYNNKTDIVLCFFSEKEIPYDYRSDEQQRKIIMDQFSEVGWRTPELLEEVKKSTTFYFDKLCQMKMQSWTKGRVALVGDAGYCASPAAGMGGSLAIDGAAALADAFHTTNGDFELAFQDYNKRFRPFIEEVQENVINFGIDFVVPRTEEAIQARNAQQG